MTFFLMSCKYEDIWAKPTKNKIAAVRLDAGGMSWLERDITKFPTNTTIFQVQQYGGAYVSTARRRNDRQFKDCRH
jgi:hypothetical protein